MLTLQAQTADAIVCMMVGRVGFKKDGSDMPTYLHGMVQMVQAHDMGDGAGMVISNRYTGIWARFAEIVNLTAAQIRGMARRPPAELTAWEKRVLLPSSRI